MARERLLLATHVCVLCRWVSWISYCLVMQRRRRMKNGWFYEWLYGCSKGTPWNSPKRPSNGKEILLGLNSLVVCANYSLRLLKETLDTMHWLRRVPSGAHKLALCLICLMCLAYYNRPCVHILSTCSCYLFVGTIRIWGLFNTSKTCLSKIWRLVR